MLPPMHVGHAPQGVVDEGGNGFGLTVVLLSDFARLRGWRREWLLVLAGGGRAEVGSVGRGEGETEGGAGDGEGGRSQGRE